MFEFCFPSKNLNENNPFSESVYFGTPVVPREGALNKLVDSNQHGTKITTTNTVVSSSDHLAMALAEKMDVTLKTNTADTLMGILESVTLEDIISNTADGSRRQRMDKEEEMLVLSEEDNGNEDQEENSDYDAPFQTDEDLVGIVERWFAMHGWAGNINNVSVPATFRSSLQRRFGQSQNTPAAAKKETSIKENGSDKNTMEQSTGVKLDSRDVFDMILHLAGKQVVGINTTVSLPTAGNERACHVYLQNATLIAFIEK